MNTELIVGTKEEIAEITNMYPERIPQISSEELNEIPELTVEQIKLVKEYDTFLTRGKMPDADHPENNTHELGENKTVKTIEAIHLNESLSYGNYSFYLDYLSDPEVKTLIDNFMCEYFEFLPSNDEQKVDFLSINPDDLSTNPSLIKAYSNIAAESFNKYRAEVARTLSKAILCNPDARKYEDLASIDRSRLTEDEVQKFLNPPVEEKFRNKAAVIAKYQEYKKLKQFYKQTYIQLKEDEKSTQNPDELSLFKAKKILISLHVERLNQMINAIIPDVAELNAKQLAMLDKHEYGIGVNKADGNFTQIGALLDKIIPEQREKKQKLLDKRRQNNLDKRPFIPWTVQDAFTITRQFLQELGLYSELPFNPKVRRAHEYRPDGVPMWVIDQRNLQNMAVNTQKRSIGLPNKDREGANAYAQFAILMHEFEHTLQGHNRDLLGLAILEAVGLGRRMLNTEGGAKYIENLTNKIVNGEDTETTLNTAYYEGVNARIRGGNALDVALHYAAEMVRSDFCKGSDVINLDNTVSEAYLEKYVRSAFRIFNGTHDYSANRNVVGSHILNYIEQDAYINAIPEEDKNIMHFAGINYKQYQILKKMGLINLDQQVILTLSEEEIKKIWKDYKKSKNLES